MDIIADEFLKDPVNYLRVECEKRGISLSDLCDAAQVDRSTVERWKNKNPHTMQILGRLQTALKEKPITV